MRLNLGCGRMVLDGWTNVDIQASPRASRPPDILSDVRSVPLPDGCADEVMALHVIEHFYLWEAPDVLREWRRLLTPGGLLVLELPNIEAAARNLLAGMTDQMCMWPLYGDPSHRDPFMCHRWGYTPATIKQLLEQNGFGDVRHKQPQYHGKRVSRDMRVEAIKS